MESVKDFDFITEPQAPFSQVNRDNLTGNFDLYERTKKILGKGNDLKRAFRSLVSLKSLDMELRLYEVFDTFLFMRIARIRTLLMSSAEF